MPEAVLRVTLSFGLRFVAGLSVPLRFYIVMLIAAYLDGLLFMLYCGNFMCISYEFFAKRRRSFHTVIFWIAFYLGTNDSEGTATSIFRCFCFEDVSSMFLRNVDNYLLQYTV
jgi:hypothetical protein